MEKNLLLSLIIVIAFVLLIPITAFSEIDFRYQWVETWEKLGDNGITMLNGIAIDSKDNIYVIDSNKLVKLTTDNQREWSVIFEIHPSGELFLNQNDEVIVPVSHKDVQELRKYSQSGELVKTWNLNDFKNDFENSFSYVDKQENIYLTQWDTIREDSTNIIGVVKKLDSEGNLLKTFENMGLLRHIDEKGNLYTTEPGKIIKYDPNGNMILGYGQQEFRGGVGTFSQHATSIIVDSNGIIFATGGDYGPINIIDEDGNFKGIGGYGIGDGRYGSPRGIALDSENNAYVTDYSRDEILVYERISLQKIIQSEPEPEPEPEAEPEPVTEPEVLEEKYFVTPLPIVCGKGTVLIDHICQVDKIEEKEIPIEKTVETTIEKTIDIPEEKPSKKSETWFSSLFDWLGGLFQ